MCFYVGCNAVVIPVVVETSCRLLVQGLMVHCPADQRWPQRGGGALPSSPVSLQSQRDSVVGSNNPEPITNS